MIPPALLRLVVVLLAVVAAIAAASPASATSDLLINQPGPRWFDQTVYQPSCTDGDCICDCRWAHFCPPVCLRW